MNNADEELQKRIENGQRVDLSPDSKAYHKIFDALKSMGCDMAQGYLISKPQAPEHFERWMRESSWAAQAAA